MGRKGVTLLEIIISVIILALIMTGLVGVLVAGKGFIQHSRYRMGGGEIGKRFIDPIHAHVRQDTWSTNPLGTNSIVDQIDGSYTAEYNVSATAGDANIKKVRAKINWSE